MDKKSSFQWKVYASKSGKKRGLKEVEIQSNQKLPTVYRDNPDYDLELKVDGQTYRKSTLKISKTKAEICKTDGTFQSIPYQHFENSIWWLLSASYNNATSHLSDLIPLAFWSLFLGIILMWGVESSQGELEMAVNLLIKENASKITVFLGVVGFCITSLVYVLVPTKCLKTEKTLLFSSEQFFGLVVGASSFCLASNFVSPAEGVKISNQMADVVLVLLICFLAHYARRFYIELNQFIDRQGRLIFAAVIVLLAGFTYVGIT